MTRLVTMLAVWLGASGCGLLIGNFEECALTIDCAARGLVCVNHYCVQPTEATLDPRCTVLTSAGGQPAVRLGSVLPKTRADAGVNATGVAREHALQLVAEQLNPPQRQGIRGRTIELVGCDSQSSSTVAAELAQHLIDRGTIGIFTSGSAETIAAARMTVPGGALLVSVSASAPEISDYPDAPVGSDGSEPGLVWRTSTSDTVQGRVIAQRLTDGGTPRTAAVVLNDAYGQGFAQAFTALYPPAKQGTFLYAQGGDLTNAIAGAAAFAPEQLLVVAFPDDAVRIVNAARSRPELRTTPFFFTDAAKSPSLLVGLDDSLSVEGALGTAPALAPLPSDARSYFVTQYSQRFGTDPLAVSATANAFDAMMCVSLAAWQAHDRLDGATLAKGMTHLSGPGALKVPLIPTTFNTATRELDTGRPIDIDGASGPLDFDARTGEAVGPIQIWKVQQGNFVEVQVVAP